MANNLKRPLIFFAIAIIFLAIVSSIDNIMFHFFTDFFSIFIGLMIFLLAINTKVFTQKTEFLALGVSYLYITLFDILHVLSFNEIGNFSSSLNESYEFFASGRIYEATALFSIFVFFRSSKNVNYIKTHIIGATLFIVSVVLIKSNIFDVYYIDGAGQTPFKLIIGYSTFFFFLLAAFLVYKKEQNTYHKNVIVLVLLLKAFAQILHVQFVSIGDTYQTIAMIVRFASYGGLYLVYVQEVVKNPYAAVYKNFVSKEQELIHLSEKDGLTEVFNNTTTMRKIESIISNIPSSYSSLCVSMFDIDNFKIINDQYGHQIGDKVLKQVTSILTNLDYNHQIVGRYGGDEFVLAIPNQKESDIEKMYSKIFSKISAIEKEDGLLITVSAGTVFWTVEDSATDLIRKADIKMYDSKNKGKNQYSIWEQTRTT